MDEDILAMILVPFGDILFFFKRFWLFFKKPSYPFSCFSTVVLILLSDLFKRLIN